MAIYPKRRRYGTSPWARRLKPFVNTAMSAATAAASYYNTSRTYTKPQGSSGVGVTKNYDVRRQYRYKRMPRRKRRRWARFSKKVRAVMDKQIATTTKLFNDTVTNTVAVGTQNYLCCWLYGKNGASSAFECGSADIGTMAQLIDDDVGVTQNNKFGVSSAVLDLTIQNSGSTGLEIDVYDVVLKNNTRITDFGDAQGKAVNETPSVGAIPKITVNTRGMTLFDMPQLIKLMGMKILKKTKLSLASNDTATYQIRNPRNYLFSSLDILEDQSLGTGNLIEPYKTRGLIVIAKNLPNSGETAGAFKIGCTRKYAIKKFESSQFIGVYQ